jgi:RNA polymerase sigma factor (sigma-70 family)
LTTNQALEIEYNDLVKAAKKITGGDHRHLDLLHYSIDEFYQKENRDDIAKSGALRFYIVRIMMTNWSQPSSPWYKINHPNTIELEDNLTEEESEESTDYILILERMYQALEKISWYERELFKQFFQSKMSYSKFQRETGIPRTSISITINRVKDYLIEELCKQKDLNLGYLTKIFSKRSQSRKKVVKSQKN